MKVKTTSENRDLILRIMQEKTGQRATYLPLPSFAYTVGGYRLSRDGMIETDNDPCSLLPILSSLGLCDFPRPSVLQNEEDISYPIRDYSADTVFNILCILSARQYLLNRALDARGAFFVSPQLMTDLLDHPPAALCDILQALYGREDDFEGVEFSLTHVIFSGFRKCRKDEADVHRQLADRIIAAANGRKRAKAFTPRVRNQKYAFRVWMNAIGMTGSDYDRARATMLPRLPGRTDRRKITYAGRA